jgi:hypothetical protein
MNIDALRLVEGTAFLLRAPELREGKAGLLGEEWFWWFLAEVLTAAVHHKFQDKTSGGYLQLLIALNGLGTVISAHAASKIAWEPHDLLALAAEPLIRTLEDVDPADTIALVDALCAQLRVPVSPELARSEKARRLIVFMNHRIVQHNWQYAPGQFERDLFGRQDVRDSFDADKGEPGTAGKKRQGRTRSSKASALDPSDARLDSELDRSRNEAVAETRTSTGPEIRTRQENADDGQAKRTGPTSPSSSEGSAADHRADPT